VAIPKVIETMIYKLVTEAVETKQNLLNAYDDLIDYAKKYGTKEGFELLG